MNNAIEVQKLRKEFKAYSSRSGLNGAFRDLFTRNYKIATAVNDISFTVKKVKWSVTSAKMGQGNRQQLKC